MAASGIDVSVGLIVNDRGVHERICVAMTQAGLAFAVQAATAAALVLECAGREPDVVVLVGEASDPQRGADVRFLCERLPGAAVVVVSVGPGGKGVRRALRAGAQGFVFESRLSSTLAVTVLAVHAGQVAVPQELVLQVDQPPLSFREKQILGMVVLGFQNQEIAAKLHLAENTVKSHLSSIFKKLGVASRQEAAAVVLDPREGLGPGILTVPQAEIATSAGA